MEGKQLGFADYEESTAKKGTKKKKFLAEMDQVVPWKPLLDLIELVYPKASSNGGLTPIHWQPTILRTHLMQQWYSLSDPAVEDALIEVPTMHRFAGIDLISDRIHDETRILSQQIFETIKAHLKQR
jgi:IS5 family transposase